MKLPRISTLMKPLKLLLFAAAPVATMPIYAQTSSGAEPDSVVLILPNDEPGADPEKPKRVVWSTEPGIRYEIQESTTLEPDSWTTVAGFPTEAEALAQQHAFEMSGNRRFFRVAELDEQPPELVELSPGNGAFGVGRFNSVTVELADRTGIDPDLISLSIDGGPAITLADPALSLVDGALVYDLEGETALGGYGATITFSLAVADFLGNSTAYDWSFELEREVEVVPDLFVFGSPAAVRAGQKLAGLAATVAARFGGPVRMNEPPTEWTIDSVDAGTVVVAYTSVVAPTFSVGQKISNLAPARLEEIFYREVTAVAVDETAKTVTLQTTDLELADLMPEGSFTFGEDAELLEFDEDGNLVAMRSLTIELPSIGADFSGSTVYPVDEGDDSNIEVTLPEARALFYPSVTLALETRAGEVERFSARAEGRFDLAVVPQLTISDSYSKEFSKELWRHGFWVWTAVGYVPVGVEIAASITANASIQVGAEAVFTTGFRQTASMGMEGVYVKNGSPEVEWDRWFQLNPFQQVPFTYTITGNGGASVSLVPQIDVRLYGAAGLYLNVDPRLELSGSATMIDGAITEASWLLGGYADVNAGLSLIGFDAGSLPSLPPFRFFTREWGDSFSAQPTPPQISSHPKSTDISAGDTLRLDVAVDSGFSYTVCWFHNDQRLIQTGNTLTVSNARLEHSGEYRALVKGDGEGAPEVWSEVARVGVFPDGDPLESWEVSISANSNPLGEGQWWINPDPVTVVLPEGKYLISNLKSGDPVYWRWNPYPNVPYLTDYALAIGSVDNFFLSGWDRWAGDSAQEALDAARSVYLHLHESTTVFFGVADNRVERGSYSDNIGGLRLQINRYQ
ncbi:immunoglobulin domain-containing protein [Haloferula sp. A504]|uniref:immunoglobulin domain-containing protein n=1 Tax=Haloferula sp. A504 TaxID=3373601 RepID=UPI0031C9F425|nr:immunoglobulin domain-containing protein [Verrucomicrobiaceae bacterium E54]